MLELAKGRNGMRGATFIEYIVLVGAVLTAGLGFTTFGSQVRRAAVCLGSSVHSVGGDRGASGCAGADAGGAMHAPLNPSTARSERRRTSGKMATTADARRRVAWLPVRSLGPGVKLSDSTSGHGVTVVNPGTPGDNPDSRTFGANGLRENDKITFLRAGPFGWETRNVDELLRALEETKALYKRPPVVLRVERDGKEVDVVFVERDQAVGSDYVKKFYRDFLGRPATPGEIAAHEKKTPAQMIADIARSSEAKSRVADLYWKTLDRAFDGPGLATWVGALAQEQDLYSIERRMAASDEGKEIAQIRAYYKTYLGRDAQRGETRQWVGKPKADVEREIAALAAKK